MNKLEIAVAAPCPFCGYFARVQSRVAKSCASGRHYFVRCPSCHTEGPRSTLNEAEAIDRWNRRAAIQSQPDAAVGDDDLLPVGFEASHFLYDSAMTDEYNEANKFLVKRIARPFCDAKGDRIWTGPTLKAAVMAACEALDLQPPVQAQGSDAA